MASSGRPLGSMIIELDMTSLCPMLGIELE